jgi:hypothetical protein
MKNITEYIIKNPEYKYLAFYGSKNLKKLSDCEIMECFKNACKIKDRGSIDFIVDLHSIFDETIGVEHELFDNLYDICFGADKLGLTAHLYEKKVIDISLINEMFFNIKYLFSNDDEINKDIVQFFTWVYGDKISDFNLNFLFQAILRFAKFILFINTYVTYKNKCIDIHGLVYNICANKNDYSYSILDIKEYLPNNFDFSVNDNEYVGVAYKNFNIEVIKVLIKDKNVKKSINKKQIMKIISYKNKKLTKIEELMKEEMDNILLSLI